MTRYTIGTICLTADGMWSADLPYHDKDGIVSMAPVTVGDGKDLAMLLNFIGRTLSRDQSTFEARCAQLDEAAAQSNTTEAPSNG